LVRVTDRLMAVAILIAPALLAILTAILILSAVGCSSLRAMAREAAETAARTAVQEARTAVKEEASRLGTELGDRLDDQRESVIARLEERQKETRERIDSGGGGLGDELEEILLVGLISFLGGAGGGHALGRRSGRRRPPEVTGDGETPEARAG
jgi:hypothetical protein